MDRNLLLPTRPTTSLDEYLAAGGGRGLPAARERAPHGSSTSSSGGSAGPRRRRVSHRTKWRSVAGGGPELGDRYVVANGAEGEPGTFKDRPLLRANPYQVLEGLSVAATVVRHARHSSR